MRSAAQPDTAFGVWVSRWRPKGQRRASLLAPRMRVLDPSHTPSGGQPRTIAAGATLQEQ